MTSKRVHTDATILRRTVNNIIDGSLASVEIMRNHIDASKFTVHLRRFGLGVTTLAVIDDLSIDNVPYLLNRVHEITGTSIYFTLYKSKAKNKPAVYCMTRKFRSNALRISASLAYSLLESAVRDDDLTVTESRRTDEVSASEYREWYRITTHV